MSNKKQSNTIITDWLEKYGDPEIDKKVEERLEQITKEMMSDKKQSSVEWLIEQLTEVDYGCINKTFLQINNSLAGHKLRELFEQAKAMHKEEIEHAYRCGAAEIGMIAVNKPKQYYNETFGGQDNE